MLVSTLVVLVAMTYSMSTSLIHTDVERPAVEVSPVARTVGLTLAASDALYVSQAEQAAALKRLNRRNRPLFCAGTKKYAALTFDDGPSKNTPELLKLLKKHGIPATFFVLGKNANEFPDYTKQLGEYGPIMNHTWGHPALPTLAAGEIKTEMGDTQEIIKRLTGQNIMAMRPTYGARNDFSIKTVDKLGYAEILWSADSQDALNKSWGEVATKSIEGLGPGAVLLMHDGPDATLTALRKRIIPWIKKNDLAMVTVPELLVFNRPSNAQLDAGPSGCSHAGEVNVSGYFGRPAGEN